MIRAVAWTHPGVVRTSNQDAIALPGTILLGSPPGPITVIESPSTATAPFVAAVVDGMGGHAGGAEASQLVACSAAIANGELDDWLHQVSDQVYDEMSRRPELIAMGATIAGVRVSDASALVFNVGDARVYAYQSGFATLLSVDDRASTRSSELTQSIGGTAHRQYPVSHTHEMSLDDPIRLLICSDGLTEMVGLNQIQDLLDLDEPGTVVRRLVEAALGAGGNDNVSVVILDWWM